MRKMLLAGAVVLSVMATPAMALSLTFQNGGSAPFNAPINNGVLVTDFGAGGGNPGAYGGPGTFSAGGSGVYTADLTSGIAARPAFGSDGGFAAVLTGGSFTINFAAAQVFSFVLGSLDPTNAVTLKFQSGPDQTFTGATLNGGVATGDQNISTQNGRVIFDAQGLDSIIGAVFTSGENSFEFDNIVTAVPEPAAWGMMLLGFGLAGGALRLRRRSSGLAIA